MLKILNRERERRKREREGDSGRCNVQFNVHPRDDTHVDESPGL